MVIDNWIYIYKWNKKKRPSLSVILIPVSLWFLSVWLLEHASCTRRDSWDLREGNWKGRAFYLCFWVFFFFFFFLLFFSTARIGNQMKSHLVSLLYCCESDRENYCPLFISYNRCVWLIFSTFLINGVFLI